MQVFTPRFRSQPGTLKVFIQQVVVKRVVTQQPFPGDPALAYTGVTDQAIRLLGQAKLGNYNFSQAMRQPPPSTL